MKKPIAIILLIAILLGLSACHEHTWEEATCIAPRTCTECGETEGEALGHSWQEASCAAPKTCTVCLITEGGPLAHTPSEWTTITEASYDTEGIREQYCEVCAAVLGSETFRIEVVKNDRFVMEKGAWGDYLQSIYEDISADYKVDPEEDGYYVITNDYSVLVLLYHYEFSRSQMKTSEVFRDEDEKLDVNMLMAVIGNDYRLEKTVEGLILATNNSITRNKAQQLAKDLMTKDMVTYEGMTYEWTVLEGYDVLMISPAL